MMATNGKTQDVIIVGGGVAGLTVAIFLARAGCSVTLFEKSQQLGGRGTTQEKNGFYFNLGPHAFYRGGAGFQILRELGIEVSGNVPATSGYAILNGSQYTLPASPFSLFATRLLGLPAKLEAAGLLATFNKIDPQPLQHVSVREWLDNEIRHAEVRRFLLALFRLSTYTSDTVHLSAGAAIKQMQMVLTSNVYYLDDGWQTLVESLHRAAVSAGARIITGLRVDSIEWNESDGVHSVRLADGIAYPTNMVVVAASPAETYALVECSQKTILARWIEAAQPVMAACLDVGLNYLPQPKGLFALGIDSPIYLSVHSAAARLAPSRGAVIHVAKYLDPAIETDPQSDEAELTALLDLVQPGWHKAVVERRFLPKLVVSNAMVTAEQGGLAGRPGPAVPGIPGLYVAGDWVGPIGMLSDASLASAKQAAEMILAMESFASYPVSREQVVDSMSPQWGSSYE